MAPYRVAPVIIRESEDVSNQSVNEEIRRGEEIIENSVVTASLVDINGT